MINQIKETRNAVAGKQMTKVTTQTKQKDKAHLTG